jgi:hypothetical protein
MSKDLKELLAALVIIAVIWLAINFIGRYCWKEIRQKKIDRLLISRATMRSILGKAAKKHREVEKSLLLNMENASKMIMGEEVAYLFHRINEAREFKDLRTMGLCRKRLDELAETMAATRDQALAKIDAVYERSIADTKQRLKDIEEELKELDYVGS